MSTEQFAIPLGREVVVSNVNVWRKSGLSRNEFLRRIRCVKALRVGENHWEAQECSNYPVFSFFPSSLESWRNFERLHHLVNKADFSIFEERTDWRLFSLVLPRQLVRWLLNTKITTVQCQILNWVAGWLTLHRNRPDESQEDLPSGIAETVSSIRAKFYGSDVADVDSLWGSAYEDWLKNVLQRYDEASKELTGAPPPAFLKLREVDLDEADLLAWGMVKPRGFKRQLHFPYRFGYFRDDDWNRIVLRGEEDSLLRVESSNEEWSRWLHTFELYPSRKSHLFELIGSDVRMGFVYILRGEELGRYKIGWTSSENSYARRSSLQTGSAERLIEVGCFRAASEKTEDSVHKHFDHKRVRPGGEWFALSDKDIADLLNEDWRIRNNIF